MAITQDETQSIINAVISAIRTNSRTIDQLTPVTSLSDSDCFEINDGKKVTYKVLKELIAALSQNELDSLITLINRSKLKSCSITVDGNSATLTISSISKDISCSIPMATLSQAGLISADDKSLLSSVGKANGLAPLGPDGKVPAANLPASVGSSVREVIEFSNIVDDINDISISDSTTMSSTSNRCAVVYDSLNDIFLLRFLRLSSGIGLEGGNVTEQSTSPSDMVSDKIESSGGTIIVDPIGPTLSPYYYRLWSDAGSFGTISGGVVKPVSGRIYVCTSDNTISTCKSSALVLSGAAPAVINRIYEIEAFLQGVDNTQTLTGMLQDLKTEIYNHITLLDVDDIRDQLSDINEILYKGGHNKSLASQVEDNRTVIEDLASKVSYAMASLRNVDNLSDSNMERLNDLEPRVEALESSMPRAITMEEIDAMFE